MTEYYGIHVRVHLFEIKDMTTGSRCPITIMKRKIFEMYTQITTDFRTIIILLLLLIKAIQSLFLSIETNGKTRKIINIVRRTNKPNLTGFLHFYTSNINNFTLRFRCDNNSITRTDRVSQSSPSRSKFCFVFYYPMSSSRLKGDCSCHKCGSKCKDFFHNSDVFYG